MRINFRRVAAIVALVGAALTLPAVAEVVRPLLMVPTPAVAGGDGRVFVAVLNSGEAPLDYQFPAELPATLVVGGVAREVTLRLPAGRATDAVIAPGAFARQEYRFPLPANPGPSVDLSLAGGAAQRVTLPLGAEAESGSSAGAVTPAADSLPAAVKATATPKSGGKPARPDSAALAFFQEHFFPHEPMYLLMGWEDPNVKFQLSFKYRIFNASSTDPGWVVRQAPALANLYFGYTQTTLWDISAPSAPFYDTAYKPEIFYQWLQVDRGRWADWFMMDLQGGAQHASNGQDGPESRSLNVLYVMPTLYFGDTEKFHFRIAPRVYAYVGDLEDNPDIADYYGHVQLRAMMGWANSAQLSVIGTIGDGFDHGSAQIDLTYPLFDLAGGSLPVYLDLQYFTGYGETLLDYDERTSVFRAGFSLWR